METVNRHTKHSVVAVIQGVPQHQWYPSFEQSSHNGAFNETNVLVLSRSLGYPGQGVEAKHSLLENGAPTKWEEFSESIPRSLKG